jgi:hypothetical protein
VIFLHFSEVIHNTIYHAQKNIIFHRLIFLAQNRNTVEPRYNGIEGTEKKVPLNQGFHNIEVNFEGFLVEWIKIFFHKTRFPLKRGPLYRGSTVFFHFKNFPLVNFLTQNRNIFLTLQIFRQ